jgi:putative ABC transport system substrate-binding protein
MTVFNARNWRMASLSTPLLLLLACATTGGEPGAGAAILPPIADPPTRSGAPTVLIAMPNSPNFVEVRRSLVSEVQKSFNVHTVTVAPETTVADLASAIRSVSPVCVVLMNNATMNLYRQYQTANPTAAMPPAVLLMASLVEEVQARLRRATGIAYEVPGVTAFVQLRSVISTPISRVGVVYRPAFRAFVERQKSLADKEHVDLISASVPNDVTAAGLREALHTLATTNKVDAVWMLNDNGLVRDAEFVDEAWRLELNDAKLPLIVGVPNLVEPNSPLGTLAVVPDHEALGLQAANLLFDLSENDWQVETHPVELPLSVKTVVDIKLVRANFGLRPDALKHIDKALE